MTSRKSSGSMRTESAVQATADEVIERAFRNASIDGSEMTLWVTFYRFRAAARCRLSTDCVAKVESYDTADFLRKHETEDHCGFGYPQSRCRSRPWV